MGEALHSADLPSEFEGFCLKIADRNFSTRGFLFGLDQRKARFIIREHALLPWEPVVPEQSAGHSGTL